MGVFIPMVLAGAVLLAGLQLTNFVDTRERRLREAHLPDIKSTLTIAATGAFRSPKTLEELEEMAEQERRQLEAEARGEVIEDYDAPASGDSAFSLVFRTPYLRLIGVLTMFLNWVNTNGGYIMDRLVVELANEAVAAGTTGGLTEGEFISQFYASFNSVVSLAGLLIQLFLVSRLIRWVGVPIAVMVLPVLSIGAYGMISFLPILGAVRWAKTAENATDYSLNKTSTAMLFLPTTREQKYKAKQVADSFFWRLGDMDSTGLVVLGTLVLGLGTAAFAMVNLGLAIIWLVVAFFVGRQYRDLVTRGAAPRPRARRHASGLGGARARAEAGS